MLLPSKDIEQEALMTVAKLMCAAARTAPKGRGIDHLETLIVTDGAEKDQLVGELKRIAEEFSGTAAFFARDAGNIEKSGAVVLIGTTTQTMGLPACGYCGNENCAKSKELGTACSYDSINLGIALGSAVSVASAHKIDNRIMFSVGRAALNLGFFSNGVVQALAIPLYVGGKSPFFDR